MLLWKKVWEVSTTLPNVREQNSLRFQKFYSSRTETPFKLFAHREIKLFSLHSFWFFPDWRCQMDSPRAPESDRNFRCKAIKSSVSKVCCCCCWVTSVVSDTVWPHRRQPTRLPRPWDSPSKNTGVDCRFLLQCMKVKSESEVAKSLPTLSDPTDCSLPSSSIHGIVQAKVVEWGAISCSIVRFDFLLIQKKQWVWPQNFSVALLLY